MNCPGCFDVLWWLPFHWHLWIVLSVDCSQCTVFMSRSHCWVCQSTCCL